MHDPRTCNEASAYKRMVAHVPQPARAECEMRCLTRPLSRDNRLEAGHVDVKIQNCAKSEAKRP